MDLSPNDIRSFEFPTQMRGFDKDEVNSFKEQVAGALETAKQESLKLSMEIDSLKSQLTALKQFEDTIKSAAIDARRNADMTVANAKQEAELILTRAKGEAEKELSSRVHKIAELEEQITNLGLTKKSYLTKIHTLIKSHLDMVNDITTSEEVKDRQADILEVTDSEEVDAKQRETMATQPSTDPMSETEDAESAVEPEAGLSESSKTELTEALQDVLRDEDPAEAAAEESESADKPESIDPELAAALENYKKATSEQSESEPPPEQPTVTPDPGQIVETSLRADDIPPGFIAKETNGINLTNNEDSESSTARNLSVEPNSLNVDKPPKDEIPPVKPEDMAEQIYQVVATFEENMREAEKSQTKLLHHQSR
ncbi:MAG: hypothetical protein DRP45_11345, partial [Candidatus Zixiibacteriota bacterium]